MIRAGSLIEQELDGISRHHLQGDIMLQTREVAYRYYAPVRWRPDLLVIEQDLHAERFTLVAMVVFLERSPYNLYGSRLRNRLGTNAHGTR